MQVDAWLPAAARRRPGAEAVNGRSYADLDRDARAAAAGLHAAGARAGARVGIALPPGLDFVVALHATWLLGATAVPHDLRLTEAERPPADLVVDALDPGPAAGVPLVARHDLDGIALGLQTSGTTSSPKPIDLTFGNLLWSAVGAGVALGAHPDERWLCTLPLAHVGGLSILARAAITGTTASVHERWETDRAVHALAHEGVTAVSVVATTLARMLDAGLVDPPALRLALAGGGPVPPALVDRAARAGVPVAQTYGLTETCSQATSAAPGDRQPDAGPPLFFNRVRIAPDGEVLVQGPTLSPSAARDPDGFLATGDLGALDADGRLTVLGRKADTIVSGGENVSPQEVEAVLEAHPAVLEAAVLGRPDAEWGEAVVARVVLRPGTRADAAELRAFCAARLARFKAPKVVELMQDPLPRTRSGKLLRRAL